MDCCEVLFLLLFAEGGNWLYTLWRFKKMEKEKADCPEYAASNIKRDFE